MLKQLTTAVLAGGIFVVAAAAAATAAPDVVMAEYTVPSGDPGISLYVREKRPRATTRFDAGHVVLMVHGATYPAETAFDLPVEGVSFMDRLAAAGYDAFCVDVRGYGRSTRPPEMAQPAAANGPLVPTSVAAHDYAAAARYVRGLRGVDALVVMGWSWGTSIAGTYVLADQSHVRRLVEYAPQWVKDPVATPPPAPLGAYRTVTVDQARERWYNKVPESGRAGLIPAGVFEAWAAATFATDPAGAAQSPPVLRAPNGTSADSIAFWNAGKPLYDPAGITVPTLVIHGAWDADLPSYLARGYFERLGAHQKRFVEIAEGTHTVMLEKNHAVFADEVLTFLGAP